MHVKYLLVSLCWFHKQTALARVCCCGSCVVACLVSVFLPLQTAELLGVPQSTWPAGSFESGQMVLDKSRHWRGLVMSMYINSYSSFWCV